jgi:S-disulfanyl-L-cysteine oxidoreductase SoxD
MVMGSSLKFVPFLLLLASPVLAQSAQTYDVGHAATPAELAQDITISPTGANLPMGTGTAKVGAMLFVDKGCSGCHGDMGKGGVTSAPALLSAKANMPWSATNSPWDSGINIPVKMPYATIAWDFINRAMPLGNEGSLTPDEVYSITAYLMANNKLIPDDMVLNQDSLPKIVMPMQRVPSDAGGPLQWAQVPDYVPNGPRMKGYPY